jgi:acylphosphatase
MKQTLELKIFKGKEIDYDASGNVKNPTQKMTVTYGDLNYPKIMGNIKNLGACKIEVVALYNEKGEKQEFTAEMKAAALKLIYNEPEKALTPEQKQIKELNEKVESLLTGNEGKSETSDELKAARAEYEKVAGKKGSTKWSLDEVLAKTEEIKNQTK